MEKTLKIHLAEQRKQIATEILNFPVKWEIESTYTQRRTMQEFLEYMATYIEMELADQWR